VWRVGRGRLWRTAGSTGVKIGEFSEVSALPDGPRCLTRSPPAGTDQVERSAACSVRHGKGRPVPRPGGEVRPGSRPPPPRRPPAGCAEGPVDRETPILLEDAAAIPGSEFFAVTTFMVTGPFPRSYGSDTMPIACRPAVQFTPFYPADPPCGRGPVLPRARGIEAYSFRP
jgi:hypothetical protein